MLSSSVPRSSACPVSVIFGKTLDLQIFEQQSGSLPSVAGERRLVEDERDRHRHCRGFDSRPADVVGAEAGHCGRNGARSCELRRRPAAAGPRRRPACPRSVRASATMPSRFLIMFDVTAWADRGSTGAAACGSGLRSPRAAPRRRARGPGGALNSASLASGLGIFSSW